MSPAQFFHQVKMWENKRKSLMMFKKGSGGEGRGGGNHLTICICEKGKVQAFYQTQQAAKESRNVPLCNTWINVLLMDKSDEKKVM